MVVRCSACVLLILLAAGTAAAQDEPGSPLAAARFRLGPLAFSPAIALNDVGIDSNVFNDPADPKGDFTATVIPKVDLWMRLGAALVSGRAAVSYIYFQEYTSERAFNTDNAVKLEFPDARIRPYVAGTYLNAMERSGYEIDARVRHEEGSGAVGLDVPIGSTLTLGVSGARNRIRYDDSAIYEGVALAQSLTRDADAAKASLGVRVAALTTLMLEGEAAWDSFPGAPNKNAESVRVVAGIDFKPLALLEGGARVGYRRFDIADARVQDFSGVVALVNLAYPITEGTRFEVRGQRDVSYSYSMEEPYYVLSVITGTITQRLYGPVDLKGRAGWERLEYVAAAGTAAPSASHIDHETQYGGSIEFRLGEARRLGFNVDVYRRRSPIDDRNFDTIRAGVSLSFVF
jgi:hypothetical protein